MVSTYYDFYGEVVLEVSGDGGRSSRQFRTMYDHFEIDRPEGEPDVAVEQTTATPDPETVLGDPNSYYGWTGERFVVRSGSDFMSVEPGWEHVAVSPGWEPFYAIYPVEFAVRRSMVENGRGLIHASGLELDGETTLFPAWRGAGKTNTLLSVLRAGGNFLSDDRLWVGDDASARGYPLAINLQPYNVQSFDEIERQYDGPRERVRETVSRRVDERFADGTSIVEKGIRFLNHKFLQDHSRSFTEVDALFPQAEYVDESTVDNVALLRAAPSADEVRIEPLSVDEALAAVRAINCYEWNGRLREYFSAYDALVPGGSAVDRLQSVVETEERIFADLFEKVDTYLALIPREEDWGAQGIDRQVVDAVRSFDRRRSAPVGDGEMGRESPRNP